jgi:MYXO-CTERM domain-containing protein
MSQSIDRTVRLSAYAALAGAAIPAAASGAIVSQTGLNLMATPGSPLAIDFGPGFGEVFRFSVYTTFDAGGSFRSTGNGGFFSSFTSTLSQSQVVQFNPGNTGGWNQASVMNYAGATQDDPQILGLNAPIDGAQGWFGMSSNFNTRHNLAARSSYLFFSAFSYFTFSGATSTFDINSTFGTGTGFDWAPNERGFLGLRFSNNGTDFHYAWFDVEADVFNQKLTIHGWGFEDEANTRIGAGEVPAPGVAGLGLLAMGAAGVRRQRKSAA